MRDAPDIGRQPKPAGFSPIAACGVPFNAQENFMADLKDAPQENAVSKSLTGKSFIDMTGSEKITWLGKVVIMVFTGGFAFPNIFVE